MSIFLKFHLLLLIFCSIISLSIKSLNGSITSGLDQDARSAESDQTQEVEPGEDIYFDWIKTIGCNIVTNEYFGNSKK